MFTSANKSRRIWLFLHKVAIYSKYARTGYSHSFCKYFSCDAGLWIQCQVNHKNIRILMDNTYSKDEICTEQWFKRVQRHFLLPKKGSHELWLTPDLLQLPALPKASIFLNTCISNAQHFFIVPILPLD